MKLVRILLLSLFALPIAAQVTITANVPEYNFNVLPGSTRQINVQIAGGTTNLVNWSIAGTTGGAVASFINFTSNGAGAPSSPLSSVTNGLPTIQVNVGSVAGTCSISGSLGSYLVSSTGTVTVQAQSADDPTKTASFLFNVCAKTTNVIVAPAYQQAFKGQHRTIQAWVSGDTDESGTWSLTQAPGGNGVLADTTNRDVDFVATVTGRYILTYTSTSGAHTATAIVYVTPNSMPSYSMTPNGTEPRECYVDPALTGGDYEVGPGLAYTTLQATPAANTLAAGSIIRIWNKDTTGLSPTTYHEYYQIAAQGTPSQPLLVCGVPDSLGNLPIVDGQNATGQAGVSTYGGGGMLGVMSVWGGGYGRGTPYGYWQLGSAGPSYVGITGLHIKDGTPNFNYTPPGGGSPTAYPVGASCVNMRSGTYIDASGNDLDTCTNGVFTSENTNSAWAPVTQNITVVGNHIHQSGWATDFTEHQLYLQSFYLMAEHNLVDNYLSTALGSDLKWRGVEGIFRYNLFGVASSGTNGPTRIVDLVENQDAFTYVGFEGYLSTAGQTNCNFSFWCLGDTAGANVITAYQESAQKDYVYGNILLNNGAAEYQVHYGEDHDGGMTGRNGTLYFFSNTMPGAEVIFANTTTGNYDMFYQPRFAVQNNIFWNPTQIANNQYETFIGNFATNLAKTGTFSNTFPITGGSYNGSTAFGWQSGCEGTPCAWPLTNPLNPHLYNVIPANFPATSTQPFNSTTFIPPSGSAAIGAGSTGTPAGFPVRWNYYQPTGALTPRVYPLTIGAEDQTSGTPTVATPTFSPAGGTYGSTQTVTPSTITAGASIIYTLDGTTPTVSGTNCTITHGTLLAGTISVSTTQTINAIGCENAYNASGVGTATYTITGTVATPTFLPVAGTYSSAQMVTISTTTPSASLIYTTDGSTPTVASLSCTITHGTLATGPITVSSTQTIKALACLSGDVASAVASALYTITGTVANPTCTPAAGAYGPPQFVTCGSVTSGSTTVCTIDGSTPNHASPPCSGISVATSLTLNALSFKLTFADSAVISNGYTINGAASGPTFSPVGGSYGSTQTVTLSTSTSGCNAYQVWNTTNAQSGGLLTGTSSTNPIPVAVSQTIYAQVQGCPTYTPSPITNALYTISLPPTRAQFAGSATLGGTSTGK